MFEQEDFFQVLRNQILIFAKKLFLSKGVIANERNQFYQETHQAHEGQL